MRTLCLAVITAFTALPINPLAYSQNTLTPPGAPGDTMKTLDQVEARIPLDPGTSHSITEPGSYYLTGDLDPANGNAIQVRSSNVTIDLNGYTLRQSSPTSPSSAIWISGVAPVLHNVVVKNGHITGGWRAAVSLSGVENLTLEDLEIFGCVVAGIEDYEDDDELNSNVQVRRVNIAGNGGMSNGGIYLFLTQSFQIEDVQVSDVSGRGIHINDPSGTLSTSTPIRGLIEDVTVWDCGSHGINVSSDSSQGAVDQNAVTVRSAVVTDCEGVGIAANGSILNSQAHRNNSGIDGQIVKNCVAEENTGDGILASQVFDSISVFNTGDGIVGSFVQGCTSTANSNHGIVALRSISRIQNNEVNNNTQSGIHINLDLTIIVSILYRTIIADNYVYNNATGIDVRSAKNLIIRNVAANNDTNYNFVAGNFYGEIVNRTAAGATAAVNGNAAVSTLTTTDPWANFSLPGD